MDPLETDHRSMITEPDEIALFMPKKGCEDPPGCKGIIAGAQRYGVLMRYCLLCPAIKLDKGYRTVVDVEDWVSLNRVGWKAKKGKYGIYAIKYYRDKGKSRGMYLHRKITNCPKNHVVHHRNRYTLDNRRANVPTMWPQEHENLHQALRISKKTGGPTRLKNQQI